MAKMRGGFPGMGGMGGANIQQALMKAQKMQEQVLKRQEELEAEELEASSGGGAVTARVNGKRELVSIKINPQAVDPDDIEMLEDMITAAVNEALRAMADMTERELSKITGGMSLGF